MTQFFEYLLHLDDHLRELATGSNWWWPYLVMFLVMFAETGLVIFPFLPGDSLLFAAGIMAGDGVVNFWGLCLVFAVGAVAGDSTNYFIGSQFRKHVAQGKRIALFKPETLEKAHAFFARYGGRSVSIGRFVPLVRTAVPFVAGVSSMPYRRFLAFSALGTIIWVAFFCGLGFWLGRYQIVKDSYPWVVIGLVAVVLAYAVAKLLLYWLGVRSGKSAQPAPTTGRATNQTPAPN